MRMIFLYDETEDYSIMYMAHSQGGKNGTGYQTGADMIAEKNNMQGLIEFTSSKVRISSFSTLSFLDLEY